MSIFAAKTDLLGRRQCRRCGRMFTPRTEGQEYGSTCLRKINSKPDPGCPINPDVCPGDCGKGVPEHELDRFGAD
jgi:hypothetical protein